MARTAPEVGKAGRKSASRGAAAKPAMNPRRQRLWRDLALIAVAPLLLFLLACLVTYSPADPGFSSSGSITAPVVMPYQSPEPIMPCSSYLPVSAKEPVIILSQPYSDT